jgi:apolipoprotein N-acyltransferase
MVTSVKTAPKRKGKGKSPGRKPALPPAKPSRLDSHVVGIALLGLSLLMQSLIFPPLDLWPLAFVCLVPWFVVIASGRNATTAYVVSYLLGLAFFLINLSWLGPVTVEGMVALSAYLAVYYPLVACPVRHAVRRRGLPLAIIAPVAWVATELCRALVISGFPWFFLGHTQYRLETLIQISDLVGAYGVSFVVVAVNGVIADLLLRRFWKDRPATCPTRPVTRLGPVFAAALLLFTVVYGLVQLNRDTTTPGPKIAVLQQDYPNYTDPERAMRQPSAYERAQTYAELLLQARQADPDLYLLPETPWYMALNPEYLRWQGDNGTTVSKLSYEMLRDHAVATGSCVVTGAMTIIPTPYAVQATDVKHNSAYVFSPDGRPPERYDKNHCVYFGEVVPFRYGRLRFLYLWLNDRMPFGQGGFEYSITPGTEFNVFSMKPKSNPDREYSFATPICYEDVMPYVSRRFVTDPETRQKRVDMLLNISNDGWFGHSDEHPQHLAICAFRAVENRVPVARAVNTGISGFIDSNGHIHDLVNVGGRWRGAGVTGYSVATLHTDRRHSLYSRIGDVFAIVCGLLTVLVYLDYVIVRAVASRTDSPLAEQAA